MRMHCWVLAALLVAASALAADDQCDIALRPAATLLLPYFDVDTKAPRVSATQTIFTIQNTSRLPQIATVTLWTDWGYPVLTFNIFLTGYDVQPINLYDIFVNAVIAPGPAPGIGGTSSKTTVPTSPTPGSQPADNDQNPNIKSLALCDNLPGPFFQGLRKDIELIFTTGTALGTFLPCTKPSGGTHAHAIGYATIDVRATCVLALPGEPAWIGNLLFDNVLTGDYLQITPSGGRLTVQGGPLVHIRAEPEGGAAGAMPGTTLAHTFYERYAPGKVDRRQPLPAVFAPRFVFDGSDGFKTTLKIWREGFAAAGASCGAYASNSNVRFVDMFRFDEHENAVGDGFSCPTLCGPPPGPPAVIALDAGGRFPFLPEFSTSGDVGGWLYLNFGRQGWVITSMSSAAVNGTDAAAVALANGCTPPPKPGAQIGPAP